MAKPAFFHLLWYINKKISSIHNLHPLYQTCLLSFAKSEPWTDSETICWTKKSCSQCTYNLIPLHNKVIPNIRNWLHWAGSHKAGVILSTIRLRVTVRNTSFEVRTKWSSRVLRLCYCTSLFVGVIPETLDVLSMNKDTIRRIDLVRIIRTKSEARFWLWALESDTVVEWVCERDRRLGGCAREREIRQRAEEWGTTPETNNSIAFIHFFSGM